jgi:non-specific serine/threonine protein kinase
MACDLWRYWETRGHLTEGRRILTALLERLPHGVPARRRVLWVAGFLAQFQGDIPASRVLLEAGLSAAREAGDVTAEAWSSSFLSRVLYYDGDPDRGHALARTALRQHQETGNPVGVVLALMQIGYIHMCAGEAASAAHWFRECARTCESSGNVWYHAYAQWGLGVAAMLRADHERTAQLERAALCTLRHMDDSMGVVLCLDALAWAAAACDEATRAVTLAAAAEAAWAAIPAVPAPPLRQRHDAALAAARTASPGADYRAAYAKGAAMTQAEAIAFALGEPMTRPDEHRADASPGQLTHREQDVAALVAQGLSNSQIAAALVISPRTVETHVQHIMDKLCCSSRTQIAAWSVAGP